METKAKKRVLSIALVVALVAALVAGGTMAYFTDKDVADNVFTVGNVDIQLIENFQQNSKLVPCTGSAQDGSIQNAVKKEVSVKNTGSEDAYVRVHIAIPSILDNGDPDFDAGKNVLHFNYESDSVVAGQWDWTKSTGSPYDGTDWNYYTTKINDKDYNVYVVTYETALAKDEETATKAMSQVYLDKRVTSADMTKLVKALGSNWHIYVAAEACQKDGFSDAYDALNTSFGTPGKYNVDWVKVADAQTKN